MHGEDWHERGEEHRGARTLARTGADIGVPIGGRDDASACAIVALRGTHAADAKDLRHWGHLGSPGSKHPEPNQPRKQEQKERRSKERSLHGTNTSAVDDDPARVIFVPRCARIPSVWTVL